MRPVFFHGWVPDGFIILSGWIPDKPLAFRDGAIFDGTILGGEGIILLGLLS